MAALGSTDPAGVSRRRARTGNGRCRHLPSPSSRPRSPACGAARALSEAIVAAFFRADVTTARSAAIDLHAELRLLREALPGLAPEPPSSGRAAGHAVCADPAALLRRLRRDRLVPGPHGLVLETDPGLGRVDPGLLGDLSDAGSVDADAGGLTLRGAEEADRLCGRDVPGDNPHDPEEVRADA